MPYPCPYCGKLVKTQRGVKQHINQSPWCLKKQEATLTNRVLALKLAEDVSDQSISSPSESSANFHTEQTSFAAEPDVFTLPIHHSQTPDPFDNAKDSPTKSPLRKKQRNNLLETSDEEGFATTGSNDSSDYERGNVPKPNTKMLADFRDYCRQHANKHADLTRAEETSVRLLNVLKRKGPLNTYKDVLEWHLKESGRLKPHQTLKDTDEFSHRDTLLKQLLKRHNLEGLAPRTKTVTLPSSRAVVHIPCVDAAECIVSLLTDPRFEPSDYLFFDEDPLANPPDKLNYLADLNTGEAFLKTHRRLITKPNQILLPLPMYIDGAVTGQFSNLPITALKMSLGIHNRATRDKYYAWRTLGFVPAVRKGKAKGERIFEETNHLEVEDLIDLYGEETESDDNDDTNQGGSSGEEVVKAQDFHTILSAILESLIELQETGFVWDLVYNGKLYQNVEFVIFVPFVKCDTEEADLLCGKYLSRNINVKHLCRYCHCPTAEADNPRAKYPAKTQKTIERLVNRGDLVALQRISQQYIKNAWYPVRFHLANEAGIHGACPSEKLHAIQLGIFKYIREIFFQYIGKTSSLANEINGLATMYGKFLTRQSERDLPNTNFAQGIQKGKVMARDFRGILLIMAAVLSSSGGKAYLIRRKSFGGAAGIRDWSLLVELLLEWESYLSLAEMNRKDVKRLARKHVFIMYIMQQVAKRTKGMGLKLMKFHAITHLIDDMILYGVPMEFDTGSNEGHHIFSKSAAKLTQRKEETFHSQTAQRLNEFECIDLAMEEIHSGRKVWTYFDEATTTIDSNTGKKTSLKSNYEGGSSSDQDDLNTDSSVTGSQSGESSSQSATLEMRISTFGTTIEVFEDENDNSNPSFRFKTNSKTMAYCTWNMEVIAFLNDLQNLVKKYIPEPFLPIKTEHQRGKTIFRGHPNYRSSGPWKDWALIDWGKGFGTLPSHIWCFVCLTNMRIGRETIEYGGIYLADGVYAVVEVANYTENQEATTDLFTPLEMDVSGIDENGDVSGRRFYLANTEAFVGTCCVVPDIGGNPTSYYQVKPRSEWTNIFITWLRAPHDEDIKVMSDKDTDPNSD